MPNILHETQEESGNLKYPSPESPFYSFQAPYYGVSNEKEVPPSSSSVSKISPLILLVITVLAVIFFVYGLVHLVLWFLMKRPSSSLFQSNRFPETTRSRALQRQLQQLFRLHDSGLDQSTMDSLPVFYFKDVMNLRDPFDCAVCLCEFSDDDKLRLLPICGHAFHTHCIDTWLLSNSTCPLCRATLSSSGISMENPTFSFDNSWVLSNRVNGDEDSGSRDNQRPVSGEEHNEEKRVVSVRLGKFRNINGIMGGENRREETSSSRSLDARRCYSMSSYQYVEGSSNLQVILSDKSEESDLRRDCSSDVREEGKRIDGSSRGESFSVSKIWLWSKKSQFHSSSNVAFPSLQ